MPKTPNSQFEIFPAPKAPANNYKRVQDEIMQIIKAFASMDVDALETLIRHNTQLSGIGKTRADFFKMLRDKFTEVSSEGVTKYSISTSVCQNCYKNKKVYVFTEVGSLNNSFALAFKRKGDTISSISICNFAGVKKEDLAEESQCRFSYF